jgi:hypothetical protein
LLKFSRFDYASDLLNVHWNLIQEYPLSKGNSLGKLFQSIEDGIYFRNLIVNFGEFLSKLIKIASLVLHFLIF